MNQLEPGSKPLVSVITPVYNNDEHLPQAIESVLTQTYQSWEYIIVNNCSTDNSGKIARQYAAKDPRIRVMDNTTFLNVYANHNHALRQMSPAAKYCKLVFADDFIFPQCIENMVAVGEAHPTVAMVGAYGIEGNDVKWVGMPYPKNEIPGREVCRRYFLDAMNVFGTPHSLLFRADVVRKRDPFFDESYRTNRTADREVCVALLREHNFGFVYQVLTYSRLRAGSLNAAAADINAYIAGSLNDLVLYGRDFLTPQEYDRCFTKLKADYYNFLAISLVRRRRDTTFWNYHREKLTEAGVGFSRLRLARATLTRSLRAIFNPAETMEKLRKV